jgi:hypothetical protein
MFMLTIHFLGLPSLSVKIEGFEDACRLAATLVVLSGMRIEVRLPDGDAVTFQAGDDGGVKIAA